METTAEVDNKPKGGGDDVGADRTSRSLPGEMRVKGVMREPDEATEARVHGMQNGRAVRMDGEIWSQQK